MKQGDGDEHAVLAAANSEVQLRIQSVVERLAVWQQGALGLARRAGRVEDHHGVVREDGLRRARRRGRHLAFEAIAAIAALVGEGDRLGLRECRDAARPVHALAELGFGRDQGGAAVVELKGQLPGRQPRIDRDRECTDARGAEHQLEIGAAIPEGSARPDPPARRRAPRASPPFAPRGLRGPHRSGAASRRSRRVAPARRAPSAPSSRLRCEGVDRTGAQA